MKGRRSKTDIISGILARSNGLRGRVNCNCINCIYDELVPGTWRQQVRGCAVTTCSIWPVRAGSSSVKAITATLGHSTESVDLEERSKSGVVTV